MILQRLVNALEDNPPYAAYIFYSLFRFAHSLLEVPTVRMIETSAYFQILHLDHAGPDAILSVAELSE